MIEKYKYNIRECYKNIRGLRTSDIDIKLSDEQLREYMKCALDYEYFLKKYYTIVTVDGVEELFKPYNYQTTFLNKIHDNRFTIILACRQSGKGTTSIGYLLWCLLFNEHYKIGYYANKAKVARDMLARLKFAYIRLPFWMQKGVIEWNKTRIELENNSSMEVGGTTADSGRGSSLSHLILDEFAFVKPSIQLDFIASTFPTITSGKDTKVTIISTPNGMEEFHRVWQASLNGKNNYAHHKTIWSDVPGRDEKWKQSVINDIGYKKFNVEHNCEFEGSSNTLISTETLSRLSCINPIRQLYNNMLRIYEEPIEKHIYVIIADVSRGVGLDYSVFNVIDVTDYPHKQVAIFRDNQLNAIMLSGYLNNLGNFYNQAYILVELNDNGENVADKLYDEYEYENLLATGKIKGSNQYSICGDYIVGAKKGIVTTHSVKIKGGTTLPLILDNNKLILNDDITINELKTFIISKSSFAAESGYHDDTCMTLILYSWLIEQNYFKDIVDQNLANLYNKYFESINDELTKPIVIKNNSSSQKITMSMDDWLKN